MNTISVAVACPRSNIEEFLGVPLPTALAFPEEQFFPIDEAGIREVVMERPPFLMVNRAVVFGNDIILTVAHIGVERCAGHFPDRPIVPLIRMCECAAQSGVILIAMNVTDDAVPIAIGSGDSQALTKEFVEPPVTILFHGRKVREKMGLFVVDSEFYVDGKKIGALKGIKYLAPPKGAVLR